MKKGIICFGFVITVFLFVFSCTKKNADSIAGANTCDTTNVSYQKDIVPIMQDYCYSCHAGNNTAFSNGVNLEGYDNLQAWGLSGMLVGEVRHDPGFKGMPYGKPKMPDCEINRIVAWVNQDYPQ